MMHAVMVAVLLSAAPPVSGPVSVTWETVTLTDSSAKVIAHIRRWSVLPGPLTVRLEVPSGVAMASGRTSFEVPANEHPDEVLEVFELRFEQKPQRDLVLKVNGQWPGGGLSFAVPFRFGRSEPLQPTVTATGTPLVINGRQLGPSVVLPATSQR